MGDKKLEQRLKNTEIALVTLWSLMKNTLPPEHQECIDRMMSEYFDANKELGADFDLVNVFLDGQ